MTVPRRPRMNIQAKILSAVVVSGFVAFAATSPVQALTTQECSAKYQAAKQAGTLAGQKWNDFRKAECGAGASPAAAAVPASPVGTSAPGPTRAAPGPAPTAAATGAAVYPSTVDPKYAKESAGKARMHTCLDAYNAAKTAGTLGDAKWIQKGGGYYSECNKRLKG